MSLEFEIQVVLGAGQKLFGGLVDLCYDFFFNYLKITFLNLNPTCCIKLTCVRIFSEGEHFIEGGGDKTQQHVRK